jgi:hypothetical protein
MFGMMPRKKFEKANLSQKQVVAPMPKDLRSKEYIVANGAWLNLGAPKAKNMKHDNFDNEVPLVSDEFFHKKEGVRMMKELGRKSGTRDQYFEAMGIVDARQKKELNNEYCESFGDHNVNCLNGKYDEEIPLLKDTKDFLEAKELMRQIAVKAGERITEKKLNQQAIIYLKVVNDLEEKGKKLIVEQFFSNLCNGFITSGDSAILSKQ